MLTLLKQNWLLAQTMWQVNHSAHHLVSQLMLTPVQDVYDMKTAPPHLLLQLENKEDHRHASGLAQPILCCYDLRRIEAHSSYNSGDFQVLEHGTGCDEGLPAALQHGGRHRSMPALEDINTFMGTHPPDFIYSQSLPEPLLPNMVNIEMQGLNSQHVTFRQRGTHSNHNKA